MNIHPQLLGRCTKNLGTKIFSKGSVLHLNAKTAMGVGHLLGTSESNMLLGALTIDLAMRGFFTTELRPGAFDRPSTVLIQGGVASIDPLFYTITSNCSGAFAALGRSIVMRDSSAIGEAVGNILLCLKEAPLREWLARYYSKETAGVFAQKLVQNAGDFLNAPLKAELIKLLIQYTFAAQPEGWARIEAAEGNGPQNTLSSPSRATSDLGVFRQDVPSLSAANGKSPATKAAKPQVTPSGTGGSTNTTAKQQSPTGAKPASEATPRELTPAEKAAAAKLWERIEAAKKTMNAPLVGEIRKKRMVDLCRQIIRQYPESEHASKARQALASLPEKDRKRYGITDQEAGTQKK